MLLSNVTVLLLEAGGEPLPDSEIPLRAYRALGSKMDWNYYSVPQKNSNGYFKGKRASLNRGKALGGTSSINFMAYTRGNKLDYDLWAKENPGWSYEDIFPYFMKLEDYNVPKTRRDDNTDEYHHKGGPMSVSIPDFKSPLADAFLQAGEELKQSITDYNGRNQTGFMYPPVTIKDGARCSTYNCYLKPVMSRRNLFVISEALVSKILIENYTAVGVHYLRKKTLCKAKAKLEIIISAGAYNSPQLLMLSGIGPKRILEENNIPTIVHLPGIGQNLQDHVSLGGMIYILNQSVSLSRIRYDDNKYLDMWLKHRSGPMTSPLGFEGIAFFNTKFNKNTDWPDIEIYYVSDTLSHLYKSSFSFVSRLLIDQNPFDFMTFLPILLRPKSRGFVTLQSNNPHDPPVIDPKYLSHPDDWRVMVEGLRFVYKLASTKVFQQYNPILTTYPQECFLSIINQDEYDKCRLKTFATTGHHPCSTCKMGPSSDPMAVVDHRLRVHGVHNLRVADASIMPTPITGHPNVPCINDWRESC